MAGFWKDLMQYIWWLIDLAIFFFFNCDICKIVFTDNSACNLDNFFGGKFWNFGGNSSLYLVTGG